jgi:uncharacterized protein YjbI with pentapeptide repeats
MFSYERCGYENCPRPSVSFRDRCFEHLQDRHAYLGEIVDRVRGDATIKNLSLHGITLENIDITARKFYVCNFSHIVFRNVVMSKTLFNLCFFDFAVFEDCTCREMDLQNFVAAGAAFTDCDFSSSNIIQANFNGSVCKRVNFNNSDLYNSRFIEAVLDNTSFVDCNLKNVDFRRSRRETVGFKSSNAEDAFFDGNER